MEHISSKQPSGYCGVVTLKAERHPTLKRTFKTFMTFIYVAAGIIAMFSAHEIMFGSGAMVHPVWNITSYNWLPLLSQLALAAVAGSVMYSVLPKRAPKFLNVTLGNMLLNILRPLGSSIKVFAVYMINLGAPLEKPRYHKPTH